MKFRNGDKVILKTWDSLKAMSVENINDFNRQEIEELEKRGIEVLHIPALAIDNYGMMISSDDYGKYGERIMIVSGVDEFGAIYVYGRQEPFPSMALNKFN